MSALTVGVRYLFGVLVVSLAIEKKTQVKRVLDHHENQTEGEAVVEDEAAWEDTSHTSIEVPNELVPAVRKLLAKKVA